MRFLSWNVNGVRALAGKSEWRWLVENNADLIALQETKASEEQMKSIVAAMEPRHAYICSSTVKKGYSGVCVFAREEPLLVEKELPVPDLQGEGRLLHLEYPGFHFFNGYFPNGGSEILDEAGNGTGKFLRVPYKMRFFEAFLEYAERLRKEKPIVVTGDFNIAHKAIDLARPKQNEKNTGYLPEERAFLDRFVEKGYRDTFRALHEETVKYSWWSYKTRARARNIGWRIDYFFVSEELLPRVREADIEDSVLGSDHCPICLDLDI